MAVAIMDIASEFSLLTPDGKFCKTLISAEKQDLYAQLAATELGFSPVTFSNTSRKVLEDKASSELNEGPEDN